MTSRSSFVVAFAFTLLLALGAARCAKDVPLGTAPTSDAATDAGDAGAPDDSASER